MCGTLEPEDGERIPAEQNSLVRGMRATTPGTVSVLSLAGGVSVRPKKGREIIFGRNRPLVHVCVGENDLRISRRHGTLICDGNRWWVSNAGAQPIRIAESHMLFQDEQPIPLDAGYTPMFIRGSQRREHVLEIFVADIDRGQQGPLHEHGTLPATPHRLDEVEKLALTVLGQRYLRHERNPQPWTWKATAELLGEMQPDFGWKPRRVEELVAGVRHRLSRAGFAGLTAEEMPQPIGNMLNHNLIQELMRSGTLVPCDLERIDL
ncbi:FHA domain-containing protein [Nocardia macrotermitis]|uniref:FHA domain-containing protein n=1 Tax=Nocardia macrotermitis TaxID=2585198 RepID=A0A7K0DDM1_9NOCA|nr:FHA domain-containing protein [Nocardia macrotermitis]MQY23903.1 hypothetical protein [Nocardia macrotermitis]